MTYSNKIVIKSTNKNYSSGTIHNICINNTFVPLTSEYFVIAFHSQSLQ